MGTSIYNAQEGTRHNTRTYKLIRDVRAISNTHHLSRENYPKSSKNYSESESSMTELRLETVLSPNSLAFRE